jgi:hypothetical protein
LVQRDRELFAKELLEQCSLLFERGGSVVRDTRQALAVSIRTKAPAHQQRGSGWRAGNHPSSRTQGNSRAPSRERLSFQGKARALQACVLPEDWRAWQQYWRTWFPARVFGDDGKVDSNKLAVLVQQRLQQRRATDTAEPQAPKQTKKTS